MTPYQTGDIRVESEGIAKSGRDQRMHQVRHGVCQSRQTPVSERGPSEMFAGGDTFLLLLG